MTLSFKNACHQLAARYPSNLLITIGLLLLAQPACASAWKTGEIYSGNQQKIASLQEVVAALPEGGVAIVSEQHDFKPHHINQVRFLKDLAMRTAGPVSVGMEFFDWTKQDAVDAFLRGEVQEQEFLKTVGWGGNDFSNYREQVLFPIHNQGKTLAINAPRALTSRIAKVGLAGLTPQEKTNLPPNFEVGNANYFERFRETMTGHVPEAAIQRYFEAQSVWDDTMAWVVTQYLKANPGQRLVIIVGDFHATYGGGLPDRLKKRGAKSVLTVSQVNLEGLNDQEEQEMLLPHPKWGPRADYIWIER